MRALWSDRPNCSHNVSQKVKRIRCLSENYDGNSELLHRSIFSTAGSFGPLRLSSAKICVCVIAQALFSHGACEVSLNPGVLKPSLA